MLGDVLPAYAGMIPWCRSQTGARWCAPRVCGDDPGVGEVYQYASTCSPRMRG